MSNEEIRVMLKLFAARNRTNTNTYERTTNEW
jgi:hypothetical protein